LDIRGVRAIQCSFREIKKGASSREGSLPRSVAALGEG
jgi:hypothetical protein